METEGRQVAAGTGGRETGWSCSVGTGFPLGVGEIV